MFSFLNFLLVDLYEILQILIIVLDLLAPFCFAFLLFCIQQLLIELNLDLFLLNFKEQSLLGLLLLPFQLFPPLFGTLLTWVYG